MRLLKKLTVAMLTLTLFLVFNSTHIYSANEITDKQITNAVDSELMLNSTTKSYLIDIETNEGVVNLSGEVSNLLTRDRAVKIARTVKGVRAVINNISVDNSLR